MGEDAKTTLQWYINGEPVPYGDIVAVEPFVDDTAPISRSFDGEFTFTAELSDEDAEMLRESFGIMRCDRWLKAYIDTLDNNQKITHLAIRSKKFRVRKKNIQRMNKILDRAYLNVR